MDGDLESIALLGTQLCEALITSNNGAALASGLGGFASLQSTAHPFRLSDQRMTFRFNPAVSVHILNTTGRAGPNTGLAVSDPKGILSLRVETNGGYDTRVICALDGMASPKTLKNPAPNVAPNGLSDNVIPLAAIRSARSTWLQGDSGSHLNDLCADRGTMRSATLPHVGRHKAWRVINEVLPSFLTYLLHHIIGFAPLVAGCGFVFGSVLKQGTAQKMESVYWITNGPQNFAVDMEQVECAWITKCGPALHLELYDLAGHAIAALVPDRNEDLKRWNTLLASLPEMRAGLHTP
ncbi:MAG: hypothetical protein MK098_14575 [Marinovum sp.]|nr:hypothetical protein [Marinovum sp.]